MRLYKRLEPALGAIIRPRNPDRAPEPRCRRLAQPRGLRIGRASATHRRAPPRPPARSSSLQLHRRRRSPTPRRPSRRSGISPISREVRRTSTLKSRRSRLLTPIKRAPTLDRTMPAPRGRAPPPAHPGQARAACSCSAASSRCSAPPRSATPRRRPRRSASYSW